MKHRSRFLPALAAAILLAGSALPLHAAEGSFERTLQVSGAVDLDVTTGSGDITVRQGASGTVHVVGHIRSERFSMGAERKTRVLEANPPIEQNGNTVRIGHISDPDLRHGISIGYEIEVPADTRLHAQTGSGDERISGLNGPLNLGTGSGNIAVNGGSDVHANTGSGDVNIESSRGSVYANTGSGKVTLEKSEVTDCKINTGSGNVVASGVRGGLKIQTGSGDIQAEGIQAADWKLETGSGSIFVRLPADAAFDFQAHSGSGNIRSDHPLTISGSIGGQHEVRAKVRGGGPLLQARTGSGNIEIQ